MRPLKQMRRSAGASAVALHAELLALAAGADDEVRGIEFKLLYDPERARVRS